MVTIVIHFGGRAAGGRISFTTTQPVMDVLEDINKACTTGALYIIEDQGKPKVAIPCRNIERVDIEEN